MGNYINVPYSLAIRHQCLQAYINSGNTEFDEVAMNVGKGTYKAAYVTLLLLSTYIITMLKVMSSVLLNHNLESC